MLRSFFNEFKKFAMRGNVIDMAVGIIIGAAFGKIVDSLVKDIIMPPIGLLIGSMDFSNLFFVLKDVPGHHGAYASLAQAAQAGATTLNVGNFLNAVISFTIIAFAVFLLIKGINKVQSTLDSKEEAASPTTRECPYCCEQIPLAAIRCPHCTSELEVVPSAKKRGRKPCRRKPRRRSRVRRRQKRGGESPRPGRRPELIGSGQDA